MIQFVFILIFLINVSKQNSFAYCGIQGTCIPLVKAEQLASDSELGGLAHLRLNASQYVYL